MRKRKSMFDEHKDFIIQKLDEGYSIKDVFKMIDHDQGWYEYESLYWYVRKSLQYNHIKADCEHCSQVLWAALPSSKKKRPVCVPRCQIMRTDFKDKPFKCSHFVAE